jgi:predicted outer membrane repeat protein
MRTLSLISTAFAALIMLFLNGTVCAQTIWHVDADAAAGGDGLSWATAFDDLQLALAAIQAGDEVWVAEGTYTPTVPDGDRTISFSFDDFVAIGLYGGFAGWETARDQRDWQANVTVLSGDLNDDDDPATPSTYDENSYHVITARRTDQLVVLDGFTDMSGNANGPSALEQNSGGGVYVTQGHLTINQCIFDSNIGNEGAGLATVEGNPLISNCEFTSNDSTREGGGLYVEDGFATLTDCRFTGNSAEKYGGGVYTDTSETTVTNCVFTENSSDYSGGGVYTESSDTTIVNCEFTSNTSVFVGGGLFDSEGFVSLEDCRFTENASEWAGGGVFTSLSDTTIVSCEFTSNRAIIYSRAEGGGVVNISGVISIFDSSFVDNSAEYLGGAVYCLDESDATIVGCTFSRNEAFGGGAIFHGRYDLCRISFCTFDDNVAEWEGGAVDTGMHGSVIIEDSVFRSNITDSIGGALHIWTAIDVSVANCLFHANTAGATGGGLYLASETGTITGCEFEDNHAADSGGGLYNAGNATFADCVFAGNVAEMQGGGTASVSGDPLFVNCTWTENSTVNGEGGAFFNAEDEIPALVNCSIHNNSAATLGGGIYGEPSTTPLNLANSIIWSNTPDSINGAATVTYSNIEGGWPGTGNINVDPLFADSSGHLSPASPCIDAGDNSQVPIDVTEDLDGNPRFHDDPGAPDTGSGTAPLVDMGAFEYQGDSTGCVMSLDVVPNPLIAGRKARFTVSSAQPNQPTYLAYSVRGLGLTPVAPLNVTLDLRQPSQAGGMVLANGSGAAIWNLPIPGAASGREVLFQGAQVGQKSIVVGREVSR